MPTEDVVWDAHVYSQLRHERYFTTGLTELRKDELNIQLNAMYEAYGRIMNAKPEKKTNKLGWSEADEAVHRIMGR